MSDDRFKQARRSLIDRHNQRQQQQDGWDDQGDSFDDFEDEATALVDMNPPRPNSPQFAPPPNFEGDEKTEMISLDSSFDQQQHQPQQQDPGGVQMRTHSGVQPSYDGFGGQQPPQGYGQNPSQHHQYQQPQQHHQPQHQQHQQPQHHHQHPQQQENYPPPSDAELRQASPNQSLVIGDAAGYEGNTQFLNLDDFADGASFTPDDTAAGYEGNTQFVNINALQAGGPPEQMSVESDPVLREQYQFGPESIQEGEFTLIFAQNMEGRPVVLKRIWEGDPDGMPMPVRQRIQALDQIRHPRLISLNGMLASQTGAWVEINRPPGYRLTDIVHQNGPQPQETVVEWMKQAAEILHAVHQQQFVYANLTTDAIWVQDDGTVILEPFDVLAFEHRGNLGAFGPPEMNFPPDQRQIYPASDVYSLAAVMVATLTGLPLNLGEVASLDKKLSGAAMTCLQQNPQERPQTMVDFVEHLEKGGGAGASGLDFKFLLIGVAVIGLAGLGVAYYLQQQRAAAPPPPQIAKKGPAQDGNNAVVPAVDGTNAAALLGSTNAGGTNAGGTNQAADTATAEAPGQIEQDPRLTINKSFQLNPPAQGEDQVPEPDSAEAEAMRAEARELIDGIEKLVPDQQRDKYAQAMQKLAAAIRLSGGPTPADEKFLRDLFARDDVKEIQNDYFERVNKNLMDERVSRAKSIYPQLASIDATANEMEFFNRNKNVGVKRIERSRGSGDEAEDDE